MKRLSAILGLLVIGIASPVRAQLEAPNEMGVRMSEAGIVVRDMDANVKFFTRLGGTAMKIDGVDVVKFPGIFVFITKGDPLPIGKRQTAVFCGCPTDGIENSVEGHDTEAFLISILLAQQKKIKELKEFIAARRKEAEKI